MGYFVLKKGKDGSFSFSLHATDKASLLDSESYDSKDAVSNAIESMRTIASFSSRFNHKRSDDNRHYFVVLAANDTVMGTSPMYDTMDAMEQGIEIVMQCAPSAKTVDEA